ncbi:MAG TPA: cytochrome P450 [Amycolatopsis sp.]|uniref:cytochrome P450 n=1 Tax=Amycolatopsis sp. TaxID=37632 RepID=UPI002B47913F|nr:cytochrome P450 [Amycolatopsis sp.]HKS43886.1 cytochrome P450 [Amycolatopsis sp.]
MTINAPSRTSTAPLPPGPGSRAPVAVQTLLFGNFRQALMPALRRYYGDVIHLRLYPKRDVVHLANLEHIKAVFSGPATRFHAGEGNLVLKPVMGEHSVLLTDEGTHLRARKLLMPAFNGAALRGYRDMITELTRQEVRRWPSGRVFRSHDRVRALTLEIILRVVFGVSEGARLEELRGRLGEIIDIGVLDIFGWHNEKLRRYGPWRRAAENQRRVDDLIYAEIAERRRAGDLADRSDVLSRLLTAPAGDDPLTDAELRDQLVTLLLAGHETTATALAWSFHELARDQARLATAIQAADAGDEKYLEAVAKEAMRLHPVISEVARKLTEDVEIGGYRIPAGFVVLPSILLVHADAGHHPDPSRFRPERFLGDGPAAGTWFPFGGGARRCLGAGFSLLEATIVLREVLTRYRLSPDRPRRELTRPRNITSVPGRGAHISVTPRPAPPRKPLGSPS